MTCGRKTGWSLAAAACLLMGGTPVRAGGDALAAVKDGVAEVLAAVYDQGPSDQPLSQRVRPILEKRFDLAAITRRAVGRPWLKFTPAERKETEDLFSELVLRTYADSFDPSERPTIDYGEPSKLGATRTEVPTTIGYAGKTYAVTYRLEHEDDGTWRVYDVIIEGVSMISNYRSQFDVILAKGGADTLIKSLKDNIAQAAASP